MHTICMYIYICVYTMHTMYVHIYMHAYNAYNTVATRPLYIYVCIVYTHCIYTLYMYIYIYICMHCMYIHASFQQYIHLGFRV